MLPQAVEQYNLRGERVRIFFSIGEAAKFAEVSYSRMYKAIEDGQRVGRYHYCLFGEKKLSPRQVAYRAMRSKDNDVQYFETLKEASQRTNIPYKRVCALVKTNAKDKDGYTWSAPTF